MTIRWESIPSIDFSERANWQSLGKSRFAALRVRLLLVCTNGQGSRLGPVIEEHRIVPGDKITLTRRRERVVTSTEEMSAAIRAATTARLSESLSTQVSSEVSSKLPGFSGKIAAQALTKSDYELTQELERTLSSTVSHVIQDIEGQEHQIELDGSAGRRIAELRRAYRPRRWNIYLHSLDYIELECRRNWLWRQVRQTMKRVDGLRLGWPLAVMTFYEPQSDPVVVYGPADNELENPAAVEIGALSTPMPAVNAPQLEPFDVLARLAFPVNRAERTAATRRKAAGTKHAIGFATGRRSKAGRKTKAPRKTTKKRGAARARAPKTTAQRRGVTGRRTTGPRVRKK